MLEMIKISKTYKSYNGNVEALRNVNLKVDRGEFVAIVGKSGCGKSTLLNIIAGLVTPTDGIIIYNNEIITGCSKSDLHEYRNNIGIILQNFSLLNNRTVYQNVELPLRIRKYIKQSKKELVEMYLCKVGMNNKADCFPDQLSGGQKQRVAIARALVSSPNIILADEPTGALDDGNAEQIINMLRDIANSGTIVIMVTHNKDYIKKCDRCITISDGRLV